MREGFHNDLKVAIDQYIFSGYNVTNKFPRSEIYGMTSQCRRALLSIMLNYVEGYGRTKKKVMLNFYEISFGSLKESIYVFYLAYRLELISENEYKDLFLMKERIAQMVWKTIQGVKRDIGETE